MGPNIKYSTTKMSGSAVAASSKKLTVGFMLIGLLAVGTLLVAGGLQAAETNPYAKNYKAQNISQLKSLEENPDTKMFVSNHKEDDNISMLENGYDMMGSSGFEAGDVPADLALQHGKNIKADTVLVYSKYGSAKTAESKMQAIKDALKKKGEVTEQDLGAEPTVYQYYASYWAKLPMPLLGVHIIKLKQKSVAESEAAILEQKGLKIIAVIKDSPAAKAAITKGDVLLKIGEMDLVKPDDLFAAVKRYEGKTVSVELQRGDEDIKTSVALNSRK
ncbi:MAG TPA: PDZ domain-containing protein [Methylotenera sp.]|nr:PDZ domain-containing protein [Methylotenera sp.]